MNSASGKAQPMIEARVWRSTPRGGELVSYSVPNRDSQTILDVVTYIQQRLDPGLAYRFACRVGMCGSCAMTVNGQPRWTCRTHIDKVVRDGKVVIEPLANLPVIKDLVTDMSPFFAKWQKAEGRFVPTAGRGDPVARVDPASPQRLAASTAIECINCAVCYAACDIVRWKPDYLGPAALNRAWTLQNDERDGGQAARLRAVAGDAGCHNCHSHQSCMAACPNELNPTKSIAGLKRQAARAALRGEI